MKRKKSEFGQVIYIVALGLVVLLGFTALAIDGGLIYLDRRKVQNTADAASLAAALTDCTASGDMLVKARAIATANGFDNNDPDVSVNVHNPPVSGPYTGDTDYYEVVIQSLAEVAFAQIVRPGNFPVEARAVAYCQEGTTGGPVGDGNALISLRTSGDDGLKVTGSGSIEVPAGGIQVNSSHSRAISLTGSSHVEADSINVVGGFRVVGSGYISPTPTTGVSVMPDPLASLTAPTNPYSGSCTNYSLTGSGSDTIDPGLYCKISVTGSARLFLNSGVYVIDGGDFRFTGSGEITADPSGVTLILLDGSDLSITGSGDFTLEESFVYIESGKYKLTGSGSLKVDSPSSGEWAGMTLFMDQSNSSDVDIAGSGSSRMEGTMYAPSSSFTMTGSGSGFVFNAQLIVNDIKLTGSGTFNVNYIPGELYQDPNTSIPMISLVE